MQFTFIFAATLAVASTVFAAPTGHTYIRASCDAVGCFSALAPTVVSCGIAVGSEGVGLLIDGATCLNDALKTVTDFPASCNQCLKQFDVVGKAKAAGSAIKGAAEDAVDGVEDVAGKAGDVIKKIF
ncbi:hypothetical protein BDZ94DRAFT_297068 [Collybia nuda]|uniref:Fungal calcium binding protein domain-containing protein n=1 Tax=Collybia nuda TaxID=64659 RepID=A0A9P5YAG6_9AGAR|nr:hypothetical protein BDZ94DRAFT_297068 [Collybia nuda]